MSRPASVPMVLVGLAFAACGESHPIASLDPDNDPDNATATSIAVVSGAGQRAYAGEVLPEPLIVALTLQGGEAMSDAELVFERLDGSSSLGLTTATTDAAGRAAFSWQLGDRFHQAVRVSFQGGEGLQASQTTATAIARYPYRPPEPGGDGWDVGSLGAAGVDVGTISALIDSVRSGAYVNIHSLLLVRGGKLVLEEYFPETITAPGYEHLRRDDGTHYMASVHKSITSTLMGIAIDEGLIGSTAEPLYSFFPEYGSIANWSSQKESMTLDDALTMRSGLGCSDNLAFMSAHDWVKFTLDLPMVHVPGLVFNYCTGVTNVVGAAVGNAAGTALHEFAHDRLFAPLAITPVEWRFAPDGRTVSGFYFWMRPRDMLKIGQLILDGGAWKGEQIVSEDWLALATAPHAAAGGALRYGYQWWVRSFGAGASAHTVPFAWGNGGQFIFPIEALDVVVVFTGGNYDSGLEQQPFDMLQSFILPAIE